MRTDGYGYPTRDTAPNWPDHLTNGKNFVFVHGNNTDGAGARAWNSEVFKCMWWSGSEYRFHAISWESDIGGGGANYHPHVVQAFATAEGLRDYVQYSQACAGDDIVAAQSLGNVVVGSAIQDFGMEHERYYMIDAAVPLSAYDATASTHPDMVHNDWKDYTNGVWASHWHKLFQGSDDRSKLHWEGRFGNVLDKAYNIYSSSDEIFETKTMDDNTLWFFLAGAGSNVERYSWQKQEIFKGQKNRLFNGILFGLGSTDWAGWGFELDGFGGRYYTELLAETAYTVNPDALKARPVFRNTPSSVLTSSTLSRFEIDEMLAKGIPSLTQTSGRNKIPALENLERNIDLFTEDMCRNGTPRDENVWHHNDMKNLAYVYKLGIYSQLIEED